MLDELAHVRFLQGGNHALRHDFTEAIDFLNLRRRCRQQGIHRGKSLAEQLRRTGANPPNAQRKDQPVERVGTGGIDCPDQVVRRFLRHTIQLHQLRRSQAVQICHRVQQPAVLERRQILRSQSVDVHGVLGHKVDHPLHKLRRTIRIGTAQRSLLRIPHRRRVADRTAFRQLVRRSIPGVLYASQHLRNDLSGFPHHNGVAQPDVPLGDKVLIVERSTGDGGSGELDGVENRHRRDDPRSAHTELNLPQNGFLFLRLGKGVHLDHNAVSVVGVAVPCSADLLDLCLHLRCSLAAPAPWNHGREA